MSTILRDTLALAALCLLLGCDKQGVGTSTLNVPSQADLAPGGVYVAYNNGCEQGCSEIAKGDLIQTLDGNPVATREALAGLTDGKPHRLTVVSGSASKTVELVATPKSNMPPIAAVPPFWLASAEQLNATPEWARRRMFGHASPSVMLVSVDGGIVDGRQLYGKKHLMVYWDWGDRVEEAAAVDFMQVLQKAQADLAARGVSIMFVHVRFPSGRKAPMKDSDLRAWQKQWSVTEGGHTYPPLPFYRAPNETEFNRAREVGMENAFTVAENLGQSPTIVLLDEGGIVRWHSEGAQDPKAIGSSVTDPEQATIIAALTFAMEKL